MTGSTAKCTLFNLILVLLLHQYISVQTYQNKHRRSKRAILGDVESNHTAASVSPITPEFNSSLTSQERLEQLKKLKDAELTLRKNLKERGKEYENQLYENWPKLVQSFEQEGPESFKDPFGRTLLAHLNLTYTQFEQNWSRILRRLKHSKFKSIIAEYLRKLMRGVVARTTRRMSYHKSYHRYTIWPKITMFRYVTGSDFREVDEWNEQVDLNQGFSSEYVERREKFSIEKHGIRVKQGRETTTMAIIASETPIDSKYSTCHHFAFWTWDE